MRYLLAFLLCVNVAHAADFKLMLAIMKCESSYRFEVWGDDRKSYGIAQFRQSTFYEFAGMSIKEKSWPFGQPNWKNMQHQVFLLEWGLNHGYGRRWTCYRKIKGEQRDRK